MTRGLSWLKCPSSFWVFAFAAVVCAVPFPPQLLAMTFGIIAPIYLRLMAATGVPLGDVVIALAFTGAAVAAAASMFGGGGVGVCNIIALLGESWV
jgi:hypothetical protein